MFLAVSNTIFLFIYSIITIFVRLMSMLAVFVMDTPQSVLMKPKMVHINVFVKGILVVQSVRNVVLLSINANGNQAH